MMELGFDEGLFEDLNGNNSNGIDKINCRSDSSEKNNINNFGMKGEIYKPKQCTDEWFSGVSIVKDSSIEDCIEVKHEADLLYYRHRYRRAAGRYKELIICREFIQNKPILRELYESCCRCALKLGNSKEAEQYLLPLIELHANCNDPSVHLLAYDIYVAQGNHRSALFHIVNAINVNTLYPKFWLNFYSTLEELNISGENCVIIDGYEYCIRDDLLYAVLLQAQFFLRECIRGQTEGRMSHFDSVKLTLETKMKSMLMREPTLQTRVQSLLQVPDCTGTETDIENEVQTDTKGSYLSRWLSVFRVVC